MQMKARHVQRESPRRGGTSSNIQVNGNHTPKTPTRSRKSTPASRGLIKVEPQNESGRSARANRRRTQSPLSDNTPSKRVKLVKDDKPIHEIKGDGDPFAKTTGRSTPSPDNVTITVPKSLTRASVRLQRLDINPNGTPRRLSSASEKFSILDMDNAVKKKDPVSNEHHAKRKAEQQLSGESESLPVPHISEIKRKTRRSTPSRFLSMPAEAKSVHIEPGATEVNKYEESDNVQKLGENSSSDERESDSDIDESYKTRSDGPRPAVAMKKKVNELKNMVKTLKEKYEKVLGDKKEEVTRLKNELKWKDEQLAEMNNLMEKNVEQEAKIKMMLSSSKNYQEEVDKANVEEKKAKETLQQGKRNSKDKKSTGSSDKVNTPKGKRTRAQAKSKKGKDESEEEDIDALFVDKKDDDSIEDVPVTPESAKPEESKKSPMKPASSSPIKSPEKPSAGKDNDGENVDDDEKKFDGRRDIRKVMTGKKLTEETKQAAKDEKERRDRVKKEHDKHIVVTEIDKKTKLPITTKLVLACKEGTKTPLAEVHPKLVKKLKPHQVEGIEFLWDSLIESMDKLKNPEEEGGGCILAHCMGLGKTLTLISLIHMLLTGKELKKTFKKCLVVCPLNTVLNWQYEWVKWLDKKDRLPVYELASLRNHPDRVAALNKWNKTGGILIIGYQLFRILATYSGRSKKTKKAFDESLLDPGPDLVVCDEGHVLKNDASGISKSMNKIRTKKRVVLTGTPLQNNLVEYHCMVNFVKPNLLGTRREFCNRFVNPITNGQHADSTKFDVKTMKRRAHILHELLSGAVQRRDYTCLLKLLPPKHEYVVSVRLSEIQMKLYEEYMKNHMPTENSPYHGTSLFSDYQCLMRIWTHPWVLKLDEIRQEKKGYSSDRDDDLDELESSFLDDSEEEEMVGSEAEEGEVNMKDIEDKKDEVESSVSKSPVTTRTTRNSSQNASPEKPQSDNKSKTKRKAESTEPDVRKTRGKGNKDGKGVAKKEEEAKSDKSSDSGNGEGRKDRKAKVIAGEVIKHWRSRTRGKQDGNNSDDEVKVIQEEQWWHKFVEEEHETKLELSGKLILLFEILRMCETIGDKVLVFSQSLLSLDLIEAFLKYKNEEAQKINGTKKRKCDKVSTWDKDEDYLRMDGSTGATKRSNFTEQFNDADNTRLRLFLISTRAGGLGINLDSANRVIIFDASWNPSHDIQSIFRVYRFGQTKDVYVYRFLAQGTMEDKIYTRQVTKETLSQRVIDEHQIDRHFTAADLQALYKFTPDRLDDPDREEKTPPLPKDVVLAELMSSHRAWIVDYHEHDSLLENRPEENLSEEEIKTAWEDYEREKRGIFQYRQYNYTPNYNYQQPSTSGLSTTGQMILPRLPFTTSANNQVQMGSTAQQKLSFQMTQLPRVVQEILKYNPNITAEELQKRLQAFLGMHSRQAIPGLAMGTPAAPLGEAGVPLAMPEIGMPGVAIPGMHVPAQFMPIAIPGLNLPSRLPRPGRVPGSSKSQGNSSSS